MFCLVVCVVYLLFSSGTAVVPDIKRLSDPHLDDTYHVVPRNVTPICLSHTSYWISQLRQGEPWALKILDSWTKLPSGIVLASWNHLGNYDECVSVKVQDEVADFQGKYFRASSRVTVPGSPVIGDVSNAFCIPSSCTVEDIPLLMNEEIGPALGIEIIIFGVNPLDIHIKESPATLEIGALIFVILACVLTAAVVLSAFVEWRLAEKTPALVRACSLTSTCRSLFNTNKHPKDISCLHGIRIGSMLWIILGHHYGYEYGSPISNPDIFPKYFENPLILTVANGMPAVDTFFFLSGLLMCTSFLNEVKRRPSFDVIKFYIYRYLRLTIPICVLIVFYITILPLLGDGPIWNNYSYYEARYCKANWWTNLVHVNNYIYQPGFYLCVGQTWYTAIDMQLSWLSPLVLLPLYHSPRAGLQLMTLLILIACFIPFTLTYIFHFPMSSIMVPIDIPLEGVPEGNFQEMIYNATHSRAAPYLCGILLGYFLFKTKNKRTVLSKKIVYLGWTVNTLVALTIIYSLNIVYQPGYVYDLVGSSFYAGFHRLGWSFVLTWIIFACVNKYGGLADRVLSATFLLPISRLTYSAFLVHFLPMIYDFGSTRTMSSYSDFDAVHDYFGSLVFIYFLAIILYVTVEGPILALLRVMFSKGVKTVRSGEKNRDKDEKQDVQVEEKQ